MNLATRCTACGTIFRVVQDQLRVSEGWVRCGRCAEIFDAQQQLFDLSREAPPPWPTVEDVAEHNTAAATQPEPAPDAEAAHSPSQVAPPALATSSHAHIDEANLLESVWPQSAPAPRSEPAPHNGSPPPQPDSVMQISAEQARTQTSPSSDFDRIEPILDAASALPPPLHTAGDVLSDLALEQAAATDSRLWEELAPSYLSATADPTQAQVATPSFIRQAERRARWQRPGVRLALGTLGLILTLVLSLQLGWHFRDRLSAQHPGLRPSLQAMCAAFGCSIGPWQHVEGIAVQSSSLVQEGSSGRNYRLNLVLKNKTEWDLALPSVDLSVSDSNGRLIARRMLAASELTPALASLPAGSEQALHYVFSSGSQAVVGYNIEVFEP
ncbi:DUF3426 domain-containing protein [Roseateles sp. BYS180W]|uniref:DUF3426 domain-containing protein n=1 Tax=Roseateles rivi TaxID=3299028 RepID=A0ABW7FWF6_9BURK